MYLWQEGETESPKAAAGRTQQILDVKVEVAVPTLAEEEADRSTDATPDKIELVFKKAPAPLCEEDRLANLKRVFDLSAMVVSVRSEDAGTCNRCSSELTHGVQNLMASPDFI